MKLTTKSKRLGVFIFYDRDSIIDDYVIYMLDSLNQAVDNILFISNSKLDNDELKKIDKYNIDINIRDNIGLDAGAFKYAYDKYGRDYFNQYDEVILLNDTFFGPFKPFKDIINSMNDKDIDFWGLTANYDSEDGTGAAIDGYIHSHIQTYFVAYRKSVVSSDFFNNYWTSYKIAKNNSFTTVVNNHESYFTYRLEQAGFIWDTYIDLSHYKKEDYKFNYNIYGYSSYTLLNNYNCPFIKRKNFAFYKQEALYMNNGLDTVKSLEWIKNNTNYDINMIYKNIIRLYNPVDLYQSLNMNFIVSASKNKYDKKVLLLCNIANKKAYNIVKNNIESLNAVDIKLISNIYKYDKNIDYYDNFSNYLKSNKVISKYDYVCIVNIDSKTDNFSEVYDSNNIRIIDNAIKNDEYINGVINIFEENSSLGILYLPESYHNKYIMNLTGKLLEDAKMNVNNLDIETDIKHIYKSLDGIWIKSDLLKSIYSDFIDIESFVAISEYIFSGKNCLFGKIYNNEYIENDILSMEIIYNSYINSDKLELSYPNKMIVFTRTSLLRLIFRRIVPFKIRKKLKEIFKI